MVLSFGGDVRFSDLNKYSMLKKNGYSHQMDTLMDDERLRTWCHQRRGT